MEIKEWFYVRFLQDFCRILKEYEGFFAKMKGLQRNPSWFKAMKTRYIRASYEGLNGFCEKSKNLWECFADSTQFLSKFVAI